MRGEVEGLDADGFEKAAQAAKAGCPVSKALAAPRSRWTPRSTEPHRPRHGKLYPWIRGQSVGSASSAAGAGSMSSWPARRPRAAGAPRRSRVPSAISRMSRMATTAITATTAETRKIRPGRVAVGQPDQRLDGRRRVGQVGQADARPTAAWAAPGTPARLLGDEPADPAGRGPRPAPRRRSCRPGCGRRPRPSWPRRGPWPPRCSARRAPGSASSCRRRRRARPCRRRAAPVGVSWSMVDEQAEPDDDEQRAGRRGRASTGRSW